MILSSPANLCLVLHSQFSSVTQSCPTLWDPMNRSTPGLPVHHQLLEFTQTHVHRVGDAIQPSHPLSYFSSRPQSLPASESFPMSQLFARGGQSTGVSALASFLPKNSQGWSPLEWNHWISLQSKGFTSTCNLRLSPCAVSFWEVRVTCLSCIQPQVSSVQSLSCDLLFATPWTTALQASLSITSSWSLPKPMSIELVMPSNHLILCHPLLLLPSIFPSIRLFSNESALHIRWPKYWSFSFNISSSNEHPGLICFRMDWLDLLAVQGMLKSLLQHNSSKASILRCSAFFIVQF